IAAVFLDEPLTLPIVGGTILTLTGVTLILAPWAGHASEERFWFGVGTATLASVAWAVSTVLVKPPLAEMTPVTAQAIRLPLAAAAWSSLAVRRRPGGRGVGGGAGTRSRQLSTGAKCPDGAQPPRGQRTGAAW